MANTYLLGFAAVAAIAVAGVDYMVQAEAAGKKPGAYPVGAYVDTFAGRFNGMKDSRAQAARQSVSAKTHLPQAPEGWVRREYDPEISPEFEASSDLEGEQKVADALNGDFLATQMRKTAIREARTLARERVWEYVRGDEVIRLSASYAAPQENASFQGMAMEMAMTNMALMTGMPEGYAVVQGVPFLRRVDRADGDAPAPDAIVPLSLSAQIGADVRLGVEARAAPDSVRMLLERIDYDALNAMLDTPQPGIGSAAPVLKPEEEARMAALAATAWRDARMQKSADLESRVIASAGAVAGGPPASAQSDGAARQAGEGQGNILSRVKSLLGGGPAKDDAGRQADKPRRLQLSGGASCLAGSAGRFCPD